MVRDMIGRSQYFCTQSILSFEGWRRPLVDADWHAFCQAIHKGLKGKEWELYHHYKELNQATRAKKPSERQKARALWAMKAAWDRGEEYYDPARKEDLLGRTKNPSGIV